jgi:hypothetical protein
MLPQQREDITASAQVRAVNKCAFHKDWVLQWNFYLEEVILTNAIQE